MDICAMQWHQAKIRILCKIRFFLIPKGRLLIHYISEYMNSIPICLHLQMTSLGLVKNLSEYREIIGEEKL